MTHPEKLINAAVTLKANVYFDGKVVSHSVTTSDGAKKTLGLIYPGTYHFDTGAPERMTITAGACHYKLSGQVEWTLCGDGAAFEVLGNSSFDIRIETGIAEYLCEFL